ncbi:hypothetical protein [Sphingomonas sp. BK235]|jgi:hypothetical protein|uniref:hypothetical protein n=1 Tax=Sphingomonas sp. BK235 TaxID=2512131 RepID=UPI001051662E|nr:hypothetical protein [Sphingomonas sp. BK235]
MNPIFMRSLLAARDFPPSAAAPATFPPRRADRARPAARGFSPAVQRFALSYTEQAWNMVGERRDPIR